MKLTKMIGVATVYVADENTVATRNAEGAVANTLQLVGPLRVTTL